MVGATELSFATNRGSHHSMDVFAFFRNLNVFVRNKKRFELKVTAVLLNAFGLSLRKTSSFFGSQSQSRSRVLRSGRERFSEEKLSFDPKPREYSSLLTVVKCGGRSLYVWVAVDACTTHLVRCFTHKHHGESAQCAG